MADQQAAAQPVFAVAPGAFDEDVILDYSTVDARKFYKYATTPLDNKYDGSPEDLKVFLDDVQLQVTEYGWEQLVIIPEFIAGENEDDAPTHDLITEYGILTFTQVKDHATTYLGQQDRNAQDNQMFYTFLNKSLTNEGKKKVLVKQAECDVQDVKSASCFLKLIIDEAHVSTNATCRTIREQLSNLDKTMRDQGSDIAKFNAMVNDRLETLRAHGETTEENLFVLLCKGYKAASDKNFRQWIEKREDEYDDDEGLEPQVLMQRALNKYNTRKQRGLWAKPDEQEQQIIALRAQIKELDKSRKGKSTTQSKSTSSQGSSTSKSTAKKDGEKKKRETPAWMKQPPTEGKLKKEKDGKTYDWCAHHKLWCKHKTSECKKQGLQSGNQTTATQGSGDRTTRLTTAMQSVQFQEDEE